MSNLFGRTRIQRFGTVENPKAPSWIARPSESQVAEGTHEVRTCWMGPYKRAVASVRRVEEPWSLHSKMSEDPKSLARRARTNPDTGTGSRERDQILLDRPEAAQSKRGVPKSRILETPDLSELAGFEEDDVLQLLCISVLNTQRELNQYLRCVHSKLRYGGQFSGYVETIEHRRAALDARYPRRIIQIVYLIDFIWRRVLPKLSATRSLHQSLFPQKSVVLSTTELLGRLAYCGFEIEHYFDDGQALWFSARKSHLPRMEEHAPSGLIFRMTRLGLHERPIRVFKIRTMHPYSEYLQSFVSDQNGLQTNGKFRDDFRITSWGRFLRTSFLDELPMILNLFRGDIKVVGVRPISDHYASLYPEELRQQRSKHKPGLIPPLYYDLPSGFDEFLASEKRYMDAYEEHPINTDLRYFFVSLFNVLIRQARSQ